MTKDEKRRIAKLYANIGYAIGRNVTAEMAVVFSESLSDLDANDVEAALMECFKNETYLPTPARIRSRLGVLDDRDDVGVLVSAEIVSAVSKFGWCNTNRARQYLGEFAWSVVERLGGWESVCQNVTVENSHAFRAQARQLADAMHARRNGLHHREQIEYDDEEYLIDIDSEEKHDGEQS